MKIIYGNNGAGKTLYKKNKQNEGAITLTSNLSDWIAKPIDSDELKFQISQNARLITKKENEFNILIDSIQTPKNVNKTTFKDYLKKYDYKNYKLNSVEFWNLDKWNIEDNGIQINNAQQFYEIWTLFEHINISDESKLKLYSIAKMNDKIAKSKRKMINEEVNHNSLEERFNQLMQMYDKTKNELSEIYPILGNVLGNISIKILDLIFESGENFSKKELFLNSLIFYLSQAENKDNITKIAKEIIELRKNRMNLVAPQNGVIFDEITVRNKDDKTIEVEMKNPISSGQRTILILKIILNSSENPFILDDVFETLDTKNKVSAMNWLFSWEGKNNKEIEILTHDFLVEEIGTSEAAKLSKPKPTLLKITKPLKAPNPHLGSSWKTIVPKIWANSDPRAIFELLLCKIFMRYWAKVAVIQNIKGSHNLKCLKSKSDVWLHWENVSIYFYHYHPAIPFIEINDFFPFLTLTKDINTIELIDMLRDENKKFLKAHEIVLSISKVNILFDELKTQLAREKVLYDSYTSECKSHKEWEKRPVDVYNYVANKHGEDLKRSTERTLIHSLDSSPSEIVK